MGQDDKILAHDLHKTYGDFVRTGPTEITVFDPQVFTVTDGPGNNCKKAVWYDFLLPEVVVNTTRDKKLHDQRRRIWDKGFTPKEMEEYQDRIAQHAQRLESIIATAASNGEVVNATECFSWFSFDVMGEFAFARSFRMLEDKEWHHAVILLRRAMRLLGPLSPVPWLAQIGFHLIPNYWVVKDWYDMMRWYKKRMTERLEMAPENADISHHLISASMARGTIGQDRPWLNGDSIAIIIAGSDTVAPTMVFLFYELALNPEQADKIYNEVCTYDIANHNKLKNLNHLNGCINETLRLHPPVPSGGYRETPPEGVYINEKYIPGNTTLIAPRYTIGRLETCFEKAEEFIPERWYSRLEMVKSKKAFSPFSQGRYSCVGKNLAMAELRYVTAILVKKYTVRFAPGQSIEKVEAEMRDQFTAAPGDLKLLFTPR
ncbi:hypothetical protein PISL3812_05420 [Talaromyces islandicus]|uniref:Tryprostatin B 6-hydroxylase n=1 Tax=Talaromyces islandicus TaxID=28573 RepID=A0A0U1M095_TALIS|nr:hypothetical protein PISL3812_05420 [Talaromyces islandicus]